MTDTQTNATKALAAMLERKYNEARDNGATDAQAIGAVRSLWLEAIGKSVTLKTNAAIRELAREYNAAYPEAGAEIDGGTPTLVVTIVSPVKGRRYIVNAFPAVVAQDGGVISAAEPITRTMEPAYYSKVTTRAVSWARSVTGAHTQPVRLIRDGRDVSEVWSD